MKILFVDPFDRTFLSFRKELLDKLISEKHDIILCTSVTNRVIEEYSNKVSEMVNVHLNLKDKNIFNNLKIKKTYKKIIKQYKPDLILSYTIKPNLYCAFYAKHTSIIANITGLGNMFKKNGLLSRLGIFLYKKAFKNVDYVFFQNEGNYTFFVNNKIPLNNYKIIPGSGVNVDKFTPAPINKSSNIKEFLYASRAIEEKGFFVLIKVIPLLLEKYQNIHFNFLTAEEDLLENIEAKHFFEKYNDFVTILKRTDDMPATYLKNDFLISPSFYNEGISNVLLESLACGRPIITTNDNHGCMEVIRDGINGFGVESNNLESLYKAIEKAILLSKTEIEKMGIKGRQFVVENFDRNIVINTYLDTIEHLKNRR